MVTAQTQIKITLPLRAKEFLESRAQQFGLPVAGFVRHLIIQEIRDMDYPVFQASESTEKAYREAMKNRDKAIKVTNLDEFFKNL